MRLGLSGWLSKNNSSLTLLASWMRPIAGVHFVIAIDLRVRIEDMPCQTGMRAHVAQQEYSAALAAPPHPLHRGSDQQDRKEQRVGGVLIHG